jgi:ABC-type Fe3+ transport system permease subunit
MVKANWWRPIPALVLLALAVILSSAAGTPSELPGVALGWPLLLHLERAVVLVAGLGLVVLVGARATMGQFPFRLGQIEYAMEQMTAELDETAQAQDELLDALEATTESSSLEQEIEQQI